MLSSQWLTSELPKSKFAWLNLVLTFLLSACVLPTPGQNSPNTSSPSAVPRIRWIPHPGVRRYRLQIASDEQFNNIVYDGVVNGREYIPRDLTPGRYHWRINSAECRNQRFLKFASVWPGPQFSVARAGLRPYVHPRPASHLQNVERNAQRPSPRVAGVDVDRRAQFRSGAQRGSQTRATGRATC